MNVKRITGVAVSAAMLAGFGTVATATTASAGGNCYGYQYYNSDLAPRSYWVPDHNLSYAPGRYDGCVVMLQQQLNQAYGAGLATDGYFGQQTLNWVWRFQGDFHCAGGVDGVVGHNTYSCLEWVNDN
ncbi:MULTISPECIES: peptidoglycan-binding domain-containing protein [unclassified Streptomyces]|uniref:peptidoglycan-binding domain-containing protein n=1 Tax=unclassified Streptomyces TaxID=2593676 RepID=UPI002E128805|nr:MULTISPECIES: peptidoglycan-binding domain-containing protein [unclassified Streptomyces]WSR23222.1 peptidoglycan-binding protein [Streptomyces sp. NBC_01205]